MDRTLTELEGADWGDPTYDSFLVTECHRLRRVPLRDFTVENLRMMIGQSIGLPYLIPLALSALENDPMVGGDMYPGDLLAALLSLDGKGKWRWNEWPDHARRLVTIAERAATIIRGNPEQWALTAAEVVSAAQRIRRSSTPP